MKKIFLLSLFALAALADENPEPCSPQSPMYTDCQQGSNGGCGSCWSSYCVDFDAYYGIGCNAYCADPTAPCGPDRVTITSGPGGCVVNLQRCTPSSPYLCTLITSEVDNCNGELCSQTQGGQFCSSTTGMLKEKNRAKAVLASIRALHFLNGS